MGNQDSMKYTRFTTLLTILAILTLPFSICACEKQQIVESLDKPNRSLNSINNVTTSSTTIKANKTKTASDLAREEGMFLSEQSEVMDYFFKTFFSANFEAALNITSLKYRKGRSRDKIKAEWSRFYNETKKHGFDIDNLGYRSNLGSKYDSAGAVLSPDGRVIIWLDFVDKVVDQDNSLYWQVDDVKFYFDALDTTKT
jgi:hypothetical protein